MLTYGKLKHHQVAYVTTDLDEALRRLDEAYGIDRSFVMHTAEHPVEPPQPPMKLAMVRTAGTEFEIIQPLDPNDHIYTDPLPKDGSFALVFHHIAVTVHGTPEDFEAYRASIDTTVTMGRLMAKSEMTMVQLGLRISEQRERPAPRVRRRPAAAAVCRA